MPNNPFKGLVAAPYTAFNEDFSLNLQDVPRYQNFLQKNGVKGAFIAGTTGEGLSLTPAEHFHLAKAWVEASPDDFNIIVSVGASSIQQSQSYAYQARVIGADAIAVLFPGFFKPADIEALITSFKAIASVVPEIPVYYYHIPKYTGIDFPVNQFMAALISGVPNFVGVKFSSTDFLDFQTCCSHWADHLDIFSGYDELLMHGILAGGNGAVGSTYNYLTPLYLQIIKAMERGDIYKARKFQERSIQAVTLMEEFSGATVAGKAIVSQISGIDLGPLRLPLVALSEERKNELYQRLEEIGFYEYCCLP